MDLEKVVPEVPIIVRSLLFIENQNRRVCDKPALSFKGPFPTVAPHVTLLWRPSVNDVDASRRLLLYD